MLKLFTPKYKGYYYYQLSSVERAIYEPMCIGIESFSVEIMLPYASQKMVSKVFDCVLRDNPMIFYTSAYTIITDAQKQMSWIYPKYNYNPSNAKRYVSEITHYLRTFDGLREKTDKAKELYFHDFCLTHFKYDYSYKGDSYSVLGLVRNGMAVCEGIAKFIKLALDYLGTRCVLINGKANDPAHGQNTPHTWNAVEIDGQWFHLDATFDMTLKAKINRYDYFNLSDSEIRKDHFFTGKTPPCTTEDMDYYTTNGMIASSPKELATYINAKLRDGNKNFVVKLKSVSNPAEILDKVIAIVQRQATSFSNQSVSIEVRYNPSQMVFEVSNPSDTG
jgi:hypothetical protein